MPFTLAHPAAVLPLKRFCPRFLSFPGLVIGSLVPDFGYAFGQMKLDELSHRFVGSLAFCLPFGLTMLAGLFGLRSHLVQFLPADHRGIFLPLCARPVGSPVILVI